MIGIIFRLEFKASLTNTRESFKQVIAYNLHMPAYTISSELKEQEIDLEFVMGPGQSPNGEILWNQQDGENHSVKMKAYISSQQTAPEMKDYRDDLARATYNNSKKGGPSQIDTSSPSKGDRDNRRTSPLNREKRMKEELSYGER